MKKKLILFTMILIISLIIFGPIIINCLFKMDMNIYILEAEWEAGDALSFLGSILASIIGIFGVYITIEYAQSNYRDDIRNAVLPFLSLNLLKRRIKSPFLEIEETINEAQDEVSEKLEYKEQRLDKVYFIINNGKINSYRNISSNQKKLIEYSGNIWKSPRKGMHILESNNTLSLPMEIENVGKGPVIDLRVGLNLKKTKCGEKQFIEPINLKIGEYIYINIFDEDTKECDFGEYVLEFIYFDIYKNKYSQNYDINIFKDENDKILISLSFDSQQKLERKK